MGDTVTISQAEHDALYKLKKAVRIACAPAPWTKAREAAWREIAGQDELLFGDLYRFVEEADRAAD